MTKHKLKKKKEREREAHQKVVRRREGIRKARELQMSEDKEKIKEMISFEGKTQPYRKDKDLSLKLAQIEENAKILKALEDEYEKECGNRKNLGVEAIKKLEEIQKKLESIPKKKEDKNE